MSSPPSEQFVQWVRNVLAHLYDDAYLQSHALGYRLDARGDVDQATRAQRLRATLLDCIESLSPGGGAGDTAQSARAYAILSYRYLDGLAMEAIAGKLALSASQVYREHHKGVKAVASLLRDMLGGEGSEAESVDAAADGDAEVRAEAVRHEVERLRKAAHLEALDLWQVLEDAVRLLAPLTSQREVRIVLALSGTLPFVVADRVMLRQALLGLLSHATATVSQVELTAGLSSSEPGVLLDIHAHLERATCSHGAPAEAMATEGGNLEVARSLIEAQGGRLDIQCSRREWHARVALSSRARPTVLVIDDNADLIALVQRFLSGYEVSVVGATDGRQALRLAPELQPQLILLDIMMPSQDGWEILRGLREGSATEGTPVIVCSVLNEPYLSKAMGAKDHITKPLTQNRLLEVLRPWLSALDPVA